MVSLLDQCIISQLLMANALRARPLSGMLVPYPDLQTNYHHVAISVLSAMQTVFSIGAAAESALASVFVAMTHDPDRFTKANSNLARKVEELYIETVETKAVV